MSSLISSNTLFHFTDKEEKLISILKEGFKPNLCMEDFNLFIPDEPTDEEAEVLHLAIPMVCFCDIPLSKSKNHMSTYGKYGIGLRKKWGEQCNISPVLYACKKSIVPSAIFKIMANFRNNMPIYKKITKDLYWIFCFTKAYKGKKWKKEEYRFSSEDIRFYDEREWRYVPMEDLHDYSLPIRGYLDESQRHCKQDSLDNMPLNFKASDINYIIVSSEEEIIHVIDQIEKMDRFEAKDKKLLYSRLISSEKINEDF